jgi:mannose-1-phosphate guanylyltransferase
MAQYPAEADADRFTTVTPARRRLPRRAGCGTLDLLVYGGAMATAFVLAAGLGTRLRPLTEHRPKPLVPVCGVPLLAYSLASCARYGLREVVVNAHWLHEQVEAWAGEREGVQVEVSTELPDILGTGGGLKRVADRLGDTFAVLNADVLHDVDLGALLAAVPAGGAAMALRPDLDAARYGVVAADEEGVVVELTSVARAAPAGAVDRGTHFSGIHALHRDVLDRVPDGFACIVRTAYKELVPARLVRGVRYGGLWLDAGDPAAYVDANLEVLGGVAALPLDPFARAAWARTGAGREVGDRGVVAGAEVRGAAWIGPGASIGAGAVLQDCVIGAGAVVAPRSRLREVVVWDGAEVGGERARGVVHDGGWLPT